MVKKAVMVGLLLVVALTGLGLGSEIIVTSTADNGTGTFRWALQAARPGDTITFDPSVFPPEDTATIYPRSELPPIHCGDLTIDASNAGVIIDGTNVPGDWNNGLQVYSDNNTIMGLQIVDFKGSGIAIGGARANTIGGDQSIGDDPMGQGNLTSGNAIGIDLCGLGTTGNRVLGNLIGTDVSGENPWPNHQKGIWVEDGVTRTLIGPNNVIAFNEGWGVYISGPEASSNTITGNSIHSNAGAGVFLCRGANNGVLPPTISLANLAQGVVMGVALAGSVVEIYSDGGNQGMLYEGATITDDAGNWRFEKDSPMQGSNITATLTDEHGNTSSFCRPALGTSAAVLFQQGTSPSPLPLVDKTARELNDNRIWTGWPITETSCGGSPDADYVFREVTLTGDQHVEVDLNGEFEIICWDVPEFEIHPCQLDEIKLIAANGVDLAVIMRFWNKEAHARGEELSSPRFQTEDQIQDYLNYVRFIVRSLKPLVRYYVIWAEPTIQNTIQWVKVEDYIKLLRRTIPVIREEYPEAKIVTAPTDYLIYPHAQEFLFALLQSDVMPLVDVISWHPMYGTSPKHDFHREYWYEYPQLVRRIKRAAEAHGFKGDYLATELTWGVQGAEGIFDPTVPWPMVYARVEAAKYLARAIVLHLGMGVAAGHPSGMSNHMPLSYAVVQNLCTLMAGHEAIDMPVEIDIDYELVAYCAFRYPNGDRMLGVWTDGIAKDEDPGVPATIRFPGLTAETVTGIDVLHGFEQEFVFESVGDSTVIRDLLVKDYPILIRFSDVTMGPDYEETVGDGFHRLGEPGAGTVSDCDGDGVPDDEDYCPDWPGSKEANGC